MNLVMSPLASNISEGIQIDIVLYRGEYYVCYEDLEDHQEGGVQHGSSLFWVEGERKSV